MMDSFLKQEIIGKEFDKKLNDLAYEYFAKRKFNELGFLPRPGTIAMVHTLEDGMIKSIGASEPHDIINDNFGKWLAAMHAPVGTGTLFAEIGAGVPPIDITNTARSGCYFYGENTPTNRLYNSQPPAGESAIQIGSGTTAPTVSDFNIETAFPSGPEASRQTVNNAGYTDTIGRVQTAVNIGPTTNAGTVNELALFMRWNVSGVAVLTFLQSHDAISPAVDFVIGETLFCQYFFQL